MAVLIDYRVDQVAFEIEMVVDVARTETSFCSDFIGRNRSIARSRLRNGRWLFSTRLLAQRPTSCFSALPSLFIAARLERKPSAAICSGEPCRLSVFFISAALPSCLSFGDIALEDFALTIDCSP